MEIDFKPPLPKHLQRELIRKAQAGDRQALDTVTEHNMRMVSRIAANFCRRSGRDYQDAIADGSAGLHNAIRRFDLSRGTTLATFAWPHIENAMKWKPDPVEVRLDAPIGEDGDATMADLIADTRPTPDEEAHETVLREELERLMGTALTEREAKVLRNYYGWHNAPMTYKAIAAEEGVSGNRVRELVLRAEDKLRRRYRLRRDEFLLALES